MKIDKLRIKKFLSEIQKDAQELEEFLRADLDDKRTVKAIRYNLIEIIEAEANILQHILAKGKGLPCSGYLEVVELARKEGIISQSVYTMLKPFFEFRNTLVHRYWAIADEVLIRDLKEKHGKMYSFIADIEAYLKKSQ